MMYADCTTARSWSVFSALARKSWSTRLERWVQNRKLKSVGVVTVDAAFFGRRETSSMACRTATSLPRSAPRSFVSA
jgi:hypothetical protein